MLRGKRGLVVCLFIINLLVIILGCQEVSATFNNKDIIKKIKTYKLKDIIATYTTYLDQDKLNRYKNIKLAAKKLSGRVIMPGETFSFNEVVGPRSKQNGYKEAPEIINGEFVEGVGGGVCQVSSTLYNSVLLANLKIVDRTHHSRPVDYIPLGLGATVYYRRIDFKFNNNTNHPMLIMPKVISDHLTISIISKRIDQQVKIITSPPKILQPRIIKKLDKSLPLGTEKIVEIGRKGFEVVVKRVIKKGGEVIKDEIISKDVYSPKDTIVKFNTIN